MISYKIKLILSIALFILLALPVISVEDPLQDLSFKEGLNLKSQIKESLEFFKPMITLNQIKIINNIKENNFFLEDRELLINLLSNALVNAPKGSKIIINLNKRNNLFKINIANSDIYYNISKNITLNNKEIYFESKKGEGVSFSINITPILSRL
ncbi:MAG: hypothetical protein HYU63_01635 [Armatimonadetes bacterium]|nr:hypothetical protein [Armatimonadota bacterium]